MAEIQMFLYYVKKLFAADEFKAAFSAFFGVLYSILCFIFGGDIYLQAVAGVTILWLLDFITGYGHARMNPAIIPESKKVRASLYKLLFYLVLLSAGRICTFFSVTTFVYGLILGGIVYTEVFSIGENIEKMAKLKNVNLPFVALILRILRGRYNEMFEVGKEPAATSEKPKESVGKNESAG
jgi:hypothetical protein